MARVRSAVDAGEPGTTKRPADDSVLQTVQVSGPTDYEMAAELGLSVHAYRWIKRELSLIEGRMHVRETNAVSRAI
jgi:hypothetical protein